MIYLYLTIITVIIVTFKIYTNKFYNPYKLILYMGKKGVGKSTVLQKQAFTHYKKRIQDKHKKDGWNIYCNYGDTTFKGAKEIDCSRLWEQDIKPHSVVLIDEVNLLWDNRDFKKFPPELNRWFRAQRHLKVKVLMFSQTADVDKKIRDLTDRIYLVRRYFEVIIIAYPYEKDIAPPDPKRLNNPTEFVDTYLKKYFGPIGCQFTWLPKWVKTHNSFKEIAITEADRERIKKEREEKRNGNQRNNGNRPRSDRGNNSLHSTPKSRGQARGENQKIK